MKIVILTDTTLTTTLEPIEELGEREKLFLRAGRYLGIERAFEHLSLGRTQIRLINPVNGTKDWWVLTADSAIENDDNGQQITKQTN